MINDLDTQYCQLLGQLIKDGEASADRTGTGTQMIFGHQMKFDLRDGFPLLTTKKTSFRLILTELLWFVSGQTNILPLLQQRNHIWTEWPYKRWTESNSYTGNKPAVGTQAYKDEMREFENMILKDSEFARTWGELGPVYGHQWRNYGGYCDERGSEPNTGIDQLSEALELLKNDPSSRRIIVDSWNPKDLPKQALPPCHMFFQMNITDEYVDLSFMMRSSDVFLGLPYNIASYALLLMMIAKEIGKTPRYLVYTGQNVHLYKNHFEQAKQQLTHQQDHYPLPSVTIADKPLFELTAEDFTLTNYQSHEKIQAPVAV
ncbi:thymidylate synthase [Kurthia sp. Dielmo]|uniref:thymidylate synthase n=1 Tax=Kurthia sp. Dielmo TaxID=1033738 RepID=UPI0016484C1F|nr:thymidylate synthase [Kurthia sp. Dielmo]